MSSGIFERQYGARLRSDPPRLILDPASDYLIPVGQDPEEARRNISRNITGAIAAFGNVTLDRLRTRTSGMDRWRCECGMDWPQDATACLVCGKFAGEARTSYQPDFSSSMIRYEGAGGEPAWSYHTPHSTWLVADQNIGKRARVDGGMRVMVDGKDVGSVSDISYKPLAMSRGSHPSPFSVSSNFDSHGIQTVDATFAAVRAGQQQSIDEGYAALLRLTQGNALLTGIER